jgi:hypothetical protein
VTKQRIIDRFGVHANIKPNSPDTFLLKTNVILSEGLTRWLLTWGGNAKLLYPKELIDTMNWSQKK